jgi:hypothetical protein
MAAREFTNETPFVGQELYLADQEGRDLLVVVIKATYLLPRRGRPLPAEEQIPLDLAGTYHGEPGKSSLRFEPEVAPVKLGTDVALVGHAWAGGGPQRAVDVGLTVGGLSKFARVYGDRFWYRRAGMVIASDPAPFERMPLVYERAFGGWDRTPPDPSQHSVEARNPVGVGYHDPRWGLLAESAPLPNVELPYQLIASLADAPPPAGFGFIGPDWLPRRLYAGTYDAAWQAQRFPLLPEDFSPWFHSAVPPDQIVPGYLQGNERVVIYNAVPEGTLEFELPGEPPPTCAVTFQDSSTQTQQAPLDTLIIDTDADRVVLLWRTQFPIHNKVHQVRAVRVRPGAGSAFAPRAARAAAA